VTFRRLDLESPPFITSKSKTTRYPRRYVAHACCGAFISNVLLRVGSGAGHYHFEHRGVIVLAVASWVVVSQWRCGDQRRCGDHAQIIPLIGTTIRFLNVSKHRIACFGIVPRQTGQSRSWLEEAQRLDHSRNSSHALTGLSKQTTIARQ
jgi:hypothetical protein